MELGGTALRRGVIVTADALDRVYKREIANLSRVLASLYDFCYISSPTSLDRQELLTAFWQEYKHYRNLFLTAEGVVSWDEDIIKYIKFEVTRRKVADLEDFLKALDMVYNALKYDTNVEVLNKLGVRLNFKQKREKEIKPMLALPKLYADTSVYNGDHQVIVDCYKRNKNTSLVYIDSREIILRTFFNKAGIKAGVLEKFKKANVSLLFKGGTWENDLDFFWLILNSSVVCDGKAGKLVNAYIKKYNTDLSLQTSRVEFEPLPVYILHESLAEINKNNNRIRDSYKEVGQRTFNITKNGIYLEVGNSTNADISDNTEDNTINLDDILYGEYALDYSTRASLQGINILLGLSGEFISQEMVQDNNYEALGVPIIVYEVSRKRNGRREVKERKYYRIADVLYTKNTNKDGVHISKSLEPLVTNTTLAKLSSVNDELDIFTKYSVVSKECLYNKVKSKILERGLDCDIKLKDLVFDLCCALIYIGAGVSRYTLHSVYCNYITKDDYLKACILAQTAYNDLF